MLLALACASSAVAMASGCSDSSDKNGGATCQALLEDQPWAVFPDGGDAGDATDDAFDAGEDVVDAGEDVVDAGEDVFDAGEDAPAVGLDGGFDSGVDADLDTGGGPDVGPVLDAGVDAGGAIDAAPGMDATVDLDAGSGMDSGTTMTDGAMPAMDGSMAAMDGSMAMADTGVPTPPGPPCAMPVSDQPDLSSLPQQYSQCLAAADCTGVVDGQGHMLGANPDDDAGDGDAGDAGDAGDGGTAKLSCLDAILHALQARTADFSSTYAGDPARPYTPSCEPQVGINCSRLDTVCRGAPLPKPTSADPDIVEQYQNLLFDLYDTYLPTNQAAVCVEIKMNDDVPGQQDPIIAMMTRDMMSMGVFPPQDPVLVKHAVARANCGIPPAKDGKDYKFAFVRGNFAVDFYKRYRPENKTIVAPDGKAYTNTVNATPIILAAQGPSWDFTPVEGVAPGQPHEVDFTIDIVDPTGSCDECRGIKPALKPPTSTQ